MIRILALVLAVLLSGCDNVRVLSPSGDGALRSGLYVYDAYSSRGRLVYWGYLDLRVDGSGRISGTYRLPRQCTDRLGYEADCAGYIGGRADRDGGFQFGLDEGWLRSQGVADRYDEAAGRWETRFLGGGETGTFEMYPR
jgi:hypothetical protein